MKQNFSFFSQHLGEQRLDAFLSEHLPDKSRSFLQYCIKHGFVSINGKVTTKSSTAVKASMQVNISFDQPQESTTLTPNTDISLDILYEDSDILIINKPLGMSVHPGADALSKQASIAHAVLALPNVHFSIKYQTRPGIVHRLDKWTSGCLLVAKHDMALEYYSDQFKQRNIQKKYITLVMGHMKTTHGIIEGPIGRSPHDRKKMSIQHGGKSAKTEFSVLKEFATCSLLSITLHTGRTHQIRVHCASIQHPVLGDRVYGPASSFYPEFLDGQFLHAASLQFTTPQGTIVTCEAPLPANFSAFLAHLENI